MKKYIVSLLIVVFAISLLFIGIGCKSPKITELEKRMEALEEGLAKEKAEKVSPGEEEELPVVMEENAGEILAIETISVDEAYEIFKSDKNYLFIDVRSEDKYKSGHIEGAINIPSTEIENRLDEIPVDRPIIVYCDCTGNCNKSGPAAKILMENGYSQVYVIDIEVPALSEWEEKGYPVIKE